MTSYPLVPLVPQCLEEFLCLQTVEADLVSLMFLIKYLVKYKVLVTLSLNSHRLSPNHNNDILNYLNFAHYKYLFNNSSFLFILPLSLSMLIKAKVNIKIIYPAGCKNIGSKNPLINIFIINKE